MTESQTPFSAQQLNFAGLSRTDYRGLQSTLCQGCGHNSIANQIIAACYELDLKPEQVVKFTGIGCSSKSPTYFLNRSFGFNGLHGRMPSLALGGSFADTSLKGIGVSGDGDTASIGLGQFKHLVRRNVPLVYIVENNGVYGLTKGQFSATAERGLKLKNQGTNPYMPVDICMEALVANASFVARSFAGDPKQVKELIKAAFSHKGIAVLDIISPCVTFNNQEGTIHSYTWGKDHEDPLHEISFVPARDEIMVQDFEEGTVREVEHARWFDHDPEETGSGLRPDRPLAGAALPAGGAGEELAGDRAAVFQPRTALDLRPVQFAGRTVESDERRTATSCEKCFD